MQASVPRPLPLLDRRDLDHRRLQAALPRTRLGAGGQLGAKLIEDVIHRVESVREVAVVGVEDEKWGETAVAVIVAEQVTAVDTTEVDQLCREHLATFKCPRAIYVRTEPLPRNPSGKLLKKDIRPWAAEQHRGAAA